MAPHSSTIARKIPWTEEPGRLQSRGSLRVGHDWVTALSLFTCLHWRRKWQPTPVFLPGESQGQGSLVGWHLWGCNRVRHIWSDLAVAAAAEKRVGEYWNVKIYAYFLQKGCEHKKNSEHIDHIIKYICQVFDRTFSMSVSVQFRSVTQSCLTLCDPMNTSTPGLPVHHQLPEFTQTHVHRVGDAIQPSHPLSSPSPPAPNLSQHQGLFQWVNTSHEVVKELEFQLQHQSFQWTPRTDPL